MPLLYDDSEEEWKWCYNRITEPFYDRSWQVEVVGPISSSLGSGDWASIVVSNFWHQSLDAGGQISVDGLNYYPFQFTARDSNDPIIELDLDFTEEGLTSYYDVNKPHKGNASLPNAIRWTHLPKLLHKWKCSLHGHHLIVE